MGPFDIWAEPLSWVVSKVMESDRLEAEEYTRWYPIGEVVLEAFPFLSGSLEAFILSWLSPDALTDGFYWLLQVNLFSKQNLSPQLTFVKPPSSTVCRNEHIQMDPHVLTHNPLLL